jgi:iron(III) transport system substrate-binding protein
MRTLLSKFWLVGLLAVVLSTAVACQPQTIEVPVEVPVEVTRVVTETETVVEEVTVEVTRVVEVEVEVPAAAADPGRLVIYSGRSESLVAPLIAQFAEASGIEVDVRYGSTSEMAATLLEEGNNSPADIFFAQDPGGLAAAASAGLLAPLPAETLALVPDRFHSETGEWVGVSGRARTIIYNTANVAPEELPQSLEELTDPKWQGRIGWAPTNGSFQAMITAMRTVWGEEATRDWLVAMQANNPQVYPNNTSMVEAAGRGEIDLGLTNHYYLYRFLAESGEAFGARNHFLPDGGPGSLIMVSGVGVLNNAPNQANAQKFVDYLLSVPAQQYFAAQTFEYPVVEGVNTAALVTPLAELDTMAIDIPLSAMEDLAGTAALLSELGLLE